MRLLVLVLAAASLLVGVGTSAAAVLEPSAVVETEALFDDDAGGEADADDPAIWVHPTDDGASIVIGTKKNAGLGVYDLAGATLQDVQAPPAPGPDDAPGRFNNVDLLYDIKVANQRLDLAVVSDRGSDRLRIYAIDAEAAAAGGEPLRDVTSADAPLVFSADQTEVNEQATAYGLATWRSGGKGYVAVSRRSRTELGLVRLIPESDGTVSYEVVATTSLPDSFRVPDGSTWSPCEDPGDLPQVEGMVVDGERTLLFAGQEDVGIWRLRVKRSGFGSPSLVDTVREFGVPATYDEVEEECVQSGPDPGFGGTHLAADVEGLTIYRAGRRDGYLLASSQGDDAFAVYGDRGLGRYLGSFALGDGAVDLVQQSDGAHVVNVAVGPFEQGLLVTQDGENTPEMLDDQGEARDNTNFKFTPWEDVAAAFEPALRVDPNGWHPRRG